MKLRYFLQEWRTHPPFQRGEQDFSDSITFVLMLHLHFCYVDKLLHSSMLWLLLESAERSRYIQYPSQIETGYIEHVMIIYNKLTQQCSESTNTYSSNNHNKTTKILVMIQEYRHTALGLDQCAIVRRRKGYKSVILWISFSDNKSHKILKATMNVPTN